MRIKKGIQKAICGLFLVLSKHHDANETKSAIHVNNNLLKQYFCIYLYNVRLIYMNHMLESVQIKNFSDKPYLSPL